MTDREKMIELIQDAVGGCARHWAELIADHLISNGVTVQECAEWEEIEDDWSMETIYKCSACK